MEDWKQAMINALCVSILAALPIWMAYETIDYSMVQAVGGTFVGTFVALMLRYWQPPKKDVNNDVIVETESPPETDQKSGGGLMMNLFA